MIKIFNKKHDQLLTFYLVEFYEIFVLFSKDEEDQLEYFDMY